MRRGDVWTIAGGPGYAGKPRPAIIVQDDVFDKTSSVVICPVTTDASDTPLFRPVLRRGEESGLLAESRAMVDKLISVPRGRLGRRIGSLQAQEMKRVEQAILLFLGLAV